jgi:hypothetical protein
MEKECRVIESFLRIVVDCHEKKLLVAFSDFTLEQPQILLTS